MGRGLSTQQRAILALARAFNAAQSGGVPELVVHAHHVRPGDVFANGTKVATAELAWSPRLPDYTEPFGLAVLCGFRRITWHRCRWEPTTVCRKRQASMSRAVDGLLERGMLCHAMPPHYALGNFVDGDTLPGWGTNRMHDNGSVAAAPLREFWLRERTRPAYWLTAAGHDAAGPTWERHDATAIVATYMDVREVWRPGGRTHHVERFATAEAEADFRERQAAFRRTLKAMLSGVGRGRRRATSSTP